MLVVIVVINILLRICKLRKTSHQKALFYDSLSQPSRFFLLSFQLPGYLQVWYKTWSVSELW